MEVRVARLAAARRRATALLAAVTVLFVAVTAAGAHGTLLGYVQAGAEASMVGGVADWFAVTALFRHPLGLPIPHTALIVERKDQFAATLGQFVQENFLNADVLAERIRSARLVPRLAAWLADQANAARVAGHAADLVVTVAEALRDEDVQRVLDRRADPGGRRRRGGAAGRAGAAGRHRGRPSRRAVRHDRVRRRPLPRRPLRRAAPAVRGRGAPLGARRGLPAGLRPAVHPAARAAGRRWPPIPATRPGVSSTRGSPGSPTASRPIRSCASAGSASSTTSLGSTLLRDWSSELWQKAKEALRAQAADPESELRRRLADVLVAAGRRLDSDRRLHDGLERMIESGVRAVADHFHDDLAGLVTGTIERWDAAETSSQLELLLGRDLQYIRINGTVVGASVGLVLHAIVLALG